MTIAGACRPPTRDYAGGWQAAGGLLSTLLAVRAMSESRILAASTPVVAFRLLDGRLPQAALGGHGDDHRRRPISNRHCTDRPL